MSNVVQPNMKATERYEETKLRFAEAEKECATAHKAASLATQAFHEVKDRRFVLPAQCLTPQRT